VSSVYRIDLGTPALLEFRGPDAVRFLNGQLTQDVRRVAVGGISLPSCVTDARGKLQFRVTITALDETTLWVAGEAGTQEALEARLTRYLIADDVETADLTGRYTLTHFTGPMAEPPLGVIARESNRFGSVGSDWWIPTGQTIQFPETIPLLEGEALEALRITRGIPAWGHELVEGMLPPEAALEETDISYHKGCYIGQEVISRIKSAGKVNKRIARMAIAAEAPVAPGPLYDPHGGVVGELTSVSPVAVDGLYHALGYLKRGADVAMIQTAAGIKVVLWPNAESPYA